MIPEKRPREVVNQLLFRASITGEPVELRQDEVEEFENDPLRQMTKRLAENLSRQLYEGNWTHDPPVRDVPEPRPPRHLSRPYPPQFPL